LVVSNRIRPVASHVARSQTHVAHLHLYAVRHSHAAIHAASHIVACFRECSESASTATVVNHAVRPRYLAVRQYHVALQWHHHAVLQPLAAACDSTPSSELENLRPVTFVPVFFRAQNYGQLSLIITESLVFNPRNSNLQDG